MIYSEIGKFALSQGALDKGVFPIQQDDRIFGVVLQDQGKLPQVLGL